MNAVFATVVKLSERLTAAVGSTREAAGKLFDNPWKLHWHLRGLVTDVNRLWHRRVRSPPEGTDFMAEDWDTLVLLDACRFDVFSEVNWIEGDLQSRLSPGTDSHEFLQGTFAGRQFHDTVYVTANPYSTGIEDGTFHAQISLLDETWDDDLETVTPDDVLEAAIQAHEDYPNKRVIVHFMQPHGPFLSEFGRTVWENLEYCRGQYAPEPRVSRDELRRAYRENLQYVLERVETLLDEIEGRTVISADHGELLGERQRPIPIRGYEHKRHLYLPGLREVPWHAVESGDRRRVVAEAPVRRDRVDSETVGDRLSALGYVEGS